MKDKLIQWFLRERQMSEAFINSIFLAMSGGFQDAYTYFARGGVYSNAQTGNVVLLSNHIMSGEWMIALKLFVTFNRLCIRNIYCRYCAFPL